MKNIDVIQNLPKNFKNSFEVNYAGATDINQVLDITRYQDDINGLMEEIYRQPAVYAYWANLKRMAKAKYDGISEDFETWKASKLRSVMERIYSDGVKTPTAKLIDAKFLALYQSDKIYLKFRKELRFWNKRKEMLTIVDKAVESRKDQFRSLSFLLSNLMNNGLLTIDKKPNNFKKMEE